MCQSHKSLQSNTPVLKKYILNIFLIDVGVEGSGNYYDTKDDDDSWNNNYNFSNKIRKFHDTCEIKLYGVENFIGQHDKFDKSTPKRWRITDRSLETLGKGKIGD